MKKFVRATVAIVVLVLCFTLAACGSKYSSHYRATLMVRTNTSEKASVSFKSFSGTYVIKLKNPSGGKAVIDYGATLGEGSAKVYFDYNGEKLDFFEMGTGTSKEGSSEPLTTDKTVYIIIESDGKCKDGNFAFIIEKAE